MCWAKLLQIQPNEVFTGKLSQCLICLKYLNNAIIQSSCILINIHRNFHGTLKNCEKFSPANLSTFMVPVSYLVIDVNV